MLLALDTSIDFGFGPRLKSFWEICNTKLWKFNFILNFAKNNETVLLLQQKKSTRKIASKMLIDLLLFYIQIQQMSKVVVTDVTNT